MVAYSFKRQFASAIREGLKTQTIRGDRDRHARPGEMLQLFTGMRTVHCQKICEDVRCTDVRPIGIRFSAIGEIEGIVVDGTPIADLDAFATKDGFANAADMGAFWREVHGKSIGQGGAVLWTGVLIEWARPPFAPALPNEAPKTTDKTALEAMIEAARAAGPMTPAQIQEQRISFAFGMLSKSSAVTREQVADLDYARYGNLRAMEEEITALTVKCEGLRIALADREKIAARRGFTRGYVIACCNVQHETRNSEIACNVLRQIGVTQAEIDVLDLTEFDALALAKIRAGGCGDPVAAAPLPKEG